MNRNVARLIDAICVSWSKALVPPYGDGSFSSAVDGNTDCNRFVHDVCSQMGYKKFWDEPNQRPLLANQIVDRLSDRTDWIEVNGDIAQYHANGGVLVIAGWKNPTGDHGHVCMVRPGVPGASQSWGVTTSTVPKVANVSRPELCRIDSKASRAFSSDKRPRYFALKEMI